MSRPRCRAADNTARLQSGRGRDSSRVLRCQRRINVLEAERHRPFANGYGSLCREHAAASKRVHRRSKRLRPIRARKRLPDKVPWCLPPLGFWHWSPAVRANTRFRHSCEHALQLLYEGSCRHREHAASSRCEQQSGLKQGWIDQWKSHHVTGRDQRFARTAELEADAAIHMSESLHCLDRVRNQPGIEIEGGECQHLFDETASGQGKGNSSPATDSAAATLTCPCTRPRSCSIRDSTAFSSEITRRA